MLTPAITRAMTYSRVRATSALKLCRLLTTPASPTSTKASTFTAANTSSASKSKAYPDDIPGTVRDARLEDYEGVININHDVYSGRDYLPSLYSSFLRDPRMHCYVFETKGKVVGFEAAFVVDGGKTLVYRGARTTKEMQGHGVMRRLRQHLLEQMTADHTVQYLAMTTSNASGLATEPNVLKINELLATRAIHVFPYHQALLSAKVPVNDDFDTEQIKVLTSNELCDLFDDPILKPYLFPADRIIINTIPFRLMKENRKNIQLETPHIVVSEQVLESSKKGIKPTSGLVSISTWFLCPIGVCVDLELSGRSASFPELDNHVGNHLRYIRHLGVQGQIMVPHSKDIDTNVLLQVMSRYGLTPMECPFKAQYLFEQDLGKHPI